MKEHSPCIHFQGGFYIDAVEVTTQRRLILNTNKHKIGSYSKKPGSTFTTEAFILYAVDYEIETITHFLYIYVYLSTSNVFLIVEEKIKG